jgi:hypothetical protein
MQSQFKFASGQAVLKPGVQCELNMPKLPFNGVTYRAIDDSVLARIVPSESRERVTVMTTDAAYNSGTMTSPCQSDDSHLDVGASPQSNPSEAIPVCRKSDPAIFFGRRERLD